MTRGFWAALLAAALLFALTAQAVGDPRPCLGACRVTFGKCYTSTRDAARREHCLSAYAECSKNCHERAGTAAH